MELCTSCVTVSVTLWPQAPIKPDTPGREPEHGRHQCGYHAGKPEPNWDLMHPCRGPDLDARRPSETQHSKAICYSCLSWVQSSRMSRVIHEPI